MIDLSLLAKVRVYMVMHLVLLENNFDYSLVHIVKVLVIIVD